MNRTLLIQPLSIRYYRNTNKDKRLKKQLELLEAATGIGSYEIDIENLTWKGSVNFSKMLNLPLKRVYKLNELEACIHPDDLHLFKTELSTKPVTNDEFSYDYRYIGPEGEIRYMHSKCSVNRYSNGEAYRICCMDQDITGHKLTEAKLMQAIEQSELKSKMISMASHEFRNILGNVATSIDLIERYCELQQPENCKKHIQRTRKNMKNLEDILTEFLSFNKARSGKIEIMPVDFDVIPLVNGMIDDARHYTNCHIITYKHRNITQEVHLDKNLFKVCVNNLLSNAIKYSPAGGKIEVYSEINQEMNILYLSVKDNGIGIPKHDKENIFGEFYRAGNVNEISGTGIGLNMTKRLLELMNGEINFVSKENKGTTFLIKVPIV